MNLAENRAADRVRVVESFDQGSEPWNTPPLRAKTLPLSPPKQPESPKMRPLDELRDVWGPNNDEWTIYERAVLSVLVLRADNATATAVLSLPAIAKRSGASRSSVIRAIDALERAGLIERHTAKRADRTNEITRYRLRTHARSSCEPRASQPFPPPIEPSSPSSGRGSVSQTPPPVSGGHRGSVSQTPDLPSEDLPKDLPECAPPDPPAPVEPLCVVHDRAHTQEDFSNRTLEEAPPRSVSCPEPVPPPQVETEALTASAVSETAAAILDALKAHPPLSPLATRRDAEALALAAQTTAKPLDVVHTALRQLAAKVLGGVVRANRRTALGFIVNARPLEPMSSSSPAPRLKLVTPLDEGPLVSRMQSKQLLDELAARADRERAARLAALPAPDHAHLAASRSEFEAFAVRSLSARARAKVLRRLNV